ncbi:MAG TPA: AAA family ATPase [Gaiellaceae bacterium]|nr:AAA family ATPase [Gaiellaceae bacterium]
MLITGPSAAGKTTVARLLAERFGRGVHLEGDLFRRAIVRGRVEMTPGVDDAALAQLELRYRIAAAAADAYALAGFTVVHDDVVGGPLLARHARESTFVLLPSPAELERRAAGRDAEYGAFAPRQLHRLFAEETPRVGTWLDTSEQSPEETVEAILTRLPSGA